VNGRDHKLFILGSAVVPLAGFVAAVVLLWNRAVGVPDLVAFAVMYVLGAMGVSMGFHRLLAHRAFRTSRPLRALLTTAGAMAGQGPPLIWVAHHRRHHRLADKVGDPHSPFVGADESDAPFAGFAAGLRGVWHAHMGWLFNDKLTSDPIRYCPDLARDRDVRFISRNFLAFVAVGLLLPGLIDAALTGTVVGFFKGFLWGGLVRFFIGNHLTYSINSVGHYYGRRRFRTPDESRNVWWLSIPSFGESWHNNHHAFPRSFTHGMRWYEPDVSALLIGAMERIGLAWDVVRIDGAVMEKRALAMALSGGGRAAPSAPPPPLAERQVMAGAPAGATDVE
jgi:stearoyl-CoA desaturase (Delta-9 desaturase)